MGSVVCLSSEPIFYVWLLVSRQLGMDGHFIFDSNDIVVKRRAHPMSNMGYYTVCLAIGDRESLNQNV